MNKEIKIIIKYVCLIALLIVMLFPVFWLLGASVKADGEIFGNASLIPKKFDFSGYARAMEGVNNIQLLTFLKNSLVLVVPNVMATVLSSCFIAYGFARFQFPGKRLLFLLLLGTMMLPNAILVIPRYMIFNELGWLNSYLTFWIPSLLGAGSFNIYMVVQFYRGIPRELDESAKLDGCSSFGTLLHVILPLSKPAVFSIGVLQFLWTWNDYFNSLIYINEAKKFPISIALQMILGFNSKTDWQKVLATGFISIVPCVLLYAFLQKYFVEGIATSGLKG